MKHTRTASTIVCVLLLMHSIVAADEVAKQRFEFIRDTLQASRNEPPLAYSYKTQFESGQEYECRYARQGSKYWFGCVMSAQGRVLQATESAWDGENAYMRLGLGMLLISKDWTRALPTMETPEQCIMYPIYEAYGLNESSNTPDMKYTLRGVKQLTENLVTVSFDVTGLPDATYEVCHQLDRGCMPIHAICRSRSKTLTEWKNIQYTELTHAGNKYWMITSLEMFTQSAKNPDKVFLRAAHQVDPKSIVVGKDVHREMRLVPMPFERINLFDSGQVVPPADPEWKPDESIGFPFDQVVKRYSTTRQAE